MIDGVVLRRLNVFPDERGRLMEILRRDDDLFLQFGQVYMTTTYPLVVKAWHYHEKQDDYITCVKGMIKLAVYDDREDSGTRGEVNQFFIGEHNPSLVRVPRMLYHGWMCTSDKEALIVNIPTEPYNRTQPDEIRLDPHKNHIPYDWRRKDG